MRPEDQLLSYQEAFYVCVTAFEDIPQILAAPCVCLLSFQPPVSMGMYRSSYKRDYRWCEENQPTSEVYTQVPWASPCFTLRPLVPGTARGALGAFCTSRVLGPHRSPPPRPTGSHQAPKPLAPVPSPSVGNPPPGKAFGAGCANYTH